VYTDLNGIIRSKSDGSLSDGPLSPNHKIVSIFSLMWYSANCGSDSGVLVLDCAEGPRLLTNDSASENVVWSNGR